MEKKIRFTGIGELFIHSGFINLDNKSLESSISEELLSIKGPNQLESRSMFGRVTVIIEPLEHKPLTLEAEGEPIPAVSAGLGHSDNPV